MPDTLTNEQVLFPADIFPTSYSGINWAGAQGGKTVDIFGAGPVGTMAAKSAWLRGAKRVITVDTRQYRLDLARKAAKAEGILWENDKQVVDEIRSRSGDDGADVCVEAVGFAPDRNLLARAKAVASLEKGSGKVLLAGLRAVRRGGFVSALGVYSSPLRQLPHPPVFR